MATAVNDHGQTVGFSDTAAGPTHAFSWRAGRMVDLSDLGGGYSAATDVNNHGEIVGTFTDFGPLPGGDSIHVSGMNNRGRIVGQSSGSAFVWRSGVLTALPHLHNGYSSAQAINDHGWIVGYSASSPAGFNEHAVRRR